MNYAQLYEFLDVDSDGKVEVVISRYNNGYRPGSRPDTVITVFAQGNDGKYDTVYDVDDVDGDDDRDDEDRETYTIAANLVSKMLTLSTVGEQQRYKQILLSFESGDANADVVFGHFEESDTDLTTPDLIVKATKLKNGQYSDVLDTSDANADGIINNDDQLIYRTIANSFRSMKDFQP